MRSERFESQTTTSNGCWTPGSEAVVYARFSPRPDADECESLEVQKARCKAYAEMAGLTIVETFLDPEVSARTVPLMARDGGSSMMDYVRHNRIKHIITVRLDRIFRSSLDGHTVMEEIRRLGCDLHFADQNGCTLNTKTAVGQMLFSVLLAFAEFEPRLTSERTSKALRHMQANGVRISKRIVYGRCVHPTDEARTVICEDERRIIEQIMELYRDGYHPKRIAKRLNRFGVSCRGKRWSGRYVGNIVERELESATL